MKIHDHGDVVTIEIIEGARWKRSSFPDPLVTADYGTIPNARIEVERLISVTFVGPRAAQLKRHLERSNMSDEIARYSAEQTARFLAGGDLGRPTYSPELEAKMKEHRNRLRTAFADCTEILTNALEDLSSHTAARLKELHEAAVNADADAMRLYITMMAELATQALVPDESP